MENSSFCQIVIESANARPGKVAMTLIGPGGAETTTFSEMLSQNRGGAYRLAQEQIAFGDHVAMLGVSMGLPSVNLVHGRGELLLYSWKFTLAILALSWLGARLAAGAGVLVSLRSATVRQAQQVLMLAIMLLLFVPVYGVQL